MVKIVEVDRVDLLLRYVGVLEGVRGTNPITTTGSLTINDRIHKACDAIESLLLDGAQAEGA